MHKKAVLKNAHALDLKTRFAISQPAVRVQTLFFTGVFIAHPLYINSLLYRHAVSTKNALLALKVMGT